MTAAVTISIAALILSFVTCISITVLVSKALSRAFSTVNAMHIRSGKHLDKTLDRLMTINWEQFVAAQSMMDPAEEGGWEGPETVTDEVTGQQVPTVWGRLRDMIDEPDEDVPEELERLSQ